MTGPAALGALALLAALAFLAAAAGLDLSTLRTLYRACSGRMMAVALHLLRDRHEAEDVVQESFLELWRRAPAYDTSRGSPEAWAIVIARSRALDRIRARGSARRAEERAGDQPPAHAPLPLEHAEASERRTRVRAALSSLPEAQRQAIELAFFAGLTQTEIAERVGEPLGTVKTRLRLAMEKLAALLGEEAA
jgi:RNA polymerase sigma-70 factor (ECF subfamily)